MDKIKQLISGTILNNKQLCEIFKCSPQGGMRKSNITNTLVLITNHIESVYSECIALHWNGAKRRLKFRLYAEIKHLMKLSLMALVFIILKCLQINNTLIQVA